MRSRSGGGGGGLWVAADWGSSCLRLWLLGGAGEVLETKSRPRGAAGLAADAFAPAFDEEIAPWRGRAGGEEIRGALICGMAGARGGWREAGYRAVPCAPAGGVPVAAQGASVAAFIVPGLSQATPCDVMRGEETQLAGLLAREPDFAGVACLPGTHCKWVRMAGGRVVAFATAMSGELFALLEARSALAAAMAGDGWDEDAFAAAVTAAAAAPERVAGMLFAVRAESLLRGLSAGAARGRVSGMVLGLEFAAMRRFWSVDDGADGAVAVVGSARLGARYAAGLRLLGARPTRYDGAALALAGLTAHWARLARLAEGG